MSNKLTEFIKERNSKNDKLIFRVFQTICLNSISDDILMSDDLFAEDEIDRSENQICHNFNRFFCMYSDDELYRKYVDKELSDSDIDDIIQCCKDINDNMKQNTDRQKEFVDEDLKIVFRNRDLLKTTLSFNHYDAYQQEKVSL